MNTSVGAGDSQCWRGGLRRVQQGPLKCCVRGHGPVSTSLQCHRLWYSPNKMPLPIFPPLRWKTSAIQGIQHGFLTVSKPHLKRAVSWCWQRLRAITFSFSTCAKVVRQDNEVLASNDSLQHFSISYVKQADPGYCLYWRACVSFRKLNFFLVCSSEKKWDGGPLLFFFLISVRWCECRMCT